MNLYTLLCLIFFCTKITTGIRDYYQGVFNRNDLLVAQDTLYKEKAHYSLATAKYVRYFKCPITYYRVMDRLGFGRGPKVQRLKGGLKENFILLYLTSAFNTPISVNIHVACANYDFKARSPIYTRTPWTREAPTTTTTTTGSKADADKVSTDAGTENEAQGNASATPVPEKEAAEAAPENKEAEKDPAGEKGETDPAGEKGVTDPAGEKGVTDPADEKGEADPDVKEGRK